MTVPCEVVSLKPSSDSYKPKLGEFDYDRIRAEDDSKCSLAECDVRKQVDLTQVVNRELCPDTWRRMMNDEFHVVIALSTMSVVLKPECLIRIVFGEVLHKRLRLRLDRIKAGQ